MSTKVITVTVDESPAFGWGNCVRRKAVLLEDLRVPIHVAIGRYEAATTEELDDLIADLSAERERR